MTPTVELTFGELIRETVELSPKHATPAEIAEKVIERASEELLQEALQDLVTLAVQRQLNRRQRRLMTELAESDTLSHKLDRQADWWARECAVRIPVGEGKWKTFGECTIADLKYQITRRLNQVDALFGQIEHYESFIKKMKKFKATVVADLTPEQVLA